MIHITECPRDAMQGIHTFIPTAEKISYLQQLLKVGFPVLDAGSFVSPKAIPQLADTHEVFDALDMSATQTKILAIVANARGASEAVAVDKVSILGFPFSVSETFQQRNTNSSIAQSLSRVEEIIELCASRNKELVIYLSMAFGNPYGDEWSPELVAKWAKTLEGMGVKNLSLADTTGISEIQGISTLYTTIQAELSSANLSMHLHSLPQDVALKAEAAYNAGCRYFDSALKGFGGCPMASDTLTGNMATEVLIQWANVNQIETGINHLELKEAERQANFLFDRYL
ncbi:MAG TPA: hydroxymethylglutaryl-CoA lyase [Flavobacteriales bacterium]|nr:hydroxymethylglutaryl-CoA lyase [Flavobacteriales bacterium]HPH82840.1 hydroxymethylglutaryl-CoA lyase [Flavobacteriales bacterium]